MLYPYPGVFVAPAYRTSRSSGYGYECPTEVTEGLCRVIPEVNTPGMVCCVPYRQNQNLCFGYGYECRTELTEDPGSGRVVQNSQKSRIRAIPESTPASKAAKKHKIDWSKKDTIINAFPITANGILHTLMYSWEKTHTSTTTTTTVFL